MEAIRIRQVIRKKGELHVLGLPFEEGQSVEMILLVEPSPLTPRSASGARALLSSGVVGLWERHTIKDSQELALQLRAKAQTRSQQT